MSSESSESTNTLFCARLPSLPRRWSSTGPFFRLHTTPVWQRRRRGRPSSSRPKAADKIGGGGRGLCRVCGDPRRAVCHSLQPVNEVYSGTSTYQADGFTKDTTVVFDCSLVAFERDEAMFLAFCWISCARSLALVGALCCQALAEMKDISTCI